MTPLPLSLLLSFAAPPASAFVPPLRSSSLLPSPPSLLLRRSFSRPSFSRRFFPRRLPATELRSSAAPTAPAAAAVRSDPAKGVPELLAAVWDMIVAQKEKGEHSVAFPNMESDLNDADWLRRFDGHMDTCKDVCDDFGISKVLFPYVDRGKIRGFTVKCYAMENQMDEDYEFDYDPMWDDYTPPDLSHLDDDDDDEFGARPVPHHVPDDDGEIIERTKSWVNKMMSDLGVCPFTVGAEKAGLPLGNVYYCVDRCTVMEEMYASYWKEVVRVERADQSDLSTTLLIAPEFAINNVEVFDMFSTTLSQPLEALKVEDLLQLVFFHPDWTFRDGEDRMGDAAAANFARRSPWPMINILRTNQVRAAQKGIPTGLVYKQNEKTLGKIGHKKLQRMLDERSWEDIGDMKVNRRDFEAIRIAQDLQDGKLDQKDIALEYDDTMAVNKLDQREIDGGDMVKVVQQALEKRLGGQSLNGAETSVTLMATDFIVDSLRQVIKDAAKAEA